MGRLTRLPWAPVNSAPVGKWPSLPRLRAWNCAEPPPNTGPGMATALVVQGMSGAAWLTRWSTAVLRAMREEPPVLTHWGGGTSLTGAGPTPS